jgi:TM2 domain-containing membrane protein YozV
VSTNPHVATCTRCSTPLDGWTDACTSCGNVPGVSPSPSAAAGPSAAPVPSRPVSSSLGPAVPTPAPYPPHPPYTAPPLHVVPAKSPGLGVLLSFLWLGAGHLYIGKIGLGVGLIVFDFFLVLLSIIPFIWVLTFPIWLITFIFVAINVSNEAKAFNHRNGIVVH